MGLASNAVHLSLIRWYSFMYYLFNWQETLQGENAIELWVPIFNKELEAEDDYQRDLSRDAVPLYKLSVN